MNNSSTSSEGYALDTLRTSAKVMAELLTALVGQLQAEPGLLSHISKQRIEDAISRHACAEQLLITAEAATRVRVHKLHGLFETKALSAMLKSRHHDSDTLVTTRIARKWLADAYKECAADVRANFTEQSEQPFAQLRSAHTH